MWLTIVPLTRVFIQTDIPVKIYLDLIKYLLPMITPLGYNACIPLRVGV